ncbi:MAG: outer membrane lipoprotein-sorting protein [Gammaproteobacteria bacterium]|nr:outer membrane lipoprotein-sorting protein [Gammaproteobacteria bacterium]
MYSISLKALTIPTLLRCIALPTLALGLAVPAMAQSAAEKGLEIATKMNRQDDGFGDTKAAMTMTLINRSGKESKRSIRALTLEVPGDGDKSLSIFDNPADVKGTASLSYSHATDPDEQWLYLPALKRVKRISSKNKSGPFMGSEFAFEDISSQEVEKFTYEFLGEETLDGVATLKMESRPAYKYSGYTRLVNWVDAEKYVLLKTEFYDRKDALLKTLKVTDYEQYLGKFWRPGRMEMVNEQTGKKTILVWSDYEFQSGLSEKDFTSAALKRLR